MVGLSVSLFWLVGQSKVSGWLSGWWSVGWAVSWAFVWSVGWLVGQCLVVDDLDDDDNGNNDIRGGG